MSKKAVGVIMAIVSCALTVVSFLILPETVITQFSFGGDATTMPRTFAIAAPALLGLGGALTAIFGDEGKQSRGMMISAVGIAVFAIMLLANH